MLIERIYDEDLAQASWLIGCQAEGSALVIDPRRDIDVYLKTAEENGLTITKVTETHIHADYLSGARELAAATGASLHLSAEGGPDWLYRFEHEPLRHDDVLKLGNISIRALYTPGHTPEHLSFLVTDHAATDKAGFLFTGDFVFVGDIGRPDLLDAAAGGEDTRFGMAGQLFASLRDVFLKLPDYVQVMPGHGAGSACGKALGSLPASTVGYEKVSAWWVPFVTAGDVAGFTAALLDDQPDAPAYFGRMKVQNRAGAPLLGRRAPLPELSGPELRERLAAGALLVDTRTREEHAASAVKGSVHVPAGNNFVTWASWAIDPETDRDLILFASSPESAEQLRAGLSRTGIDRVAGYTLTAAGLDTAPVKTITPDELDGLAGPFILDIRSEAEYAGGSIPGAVNIHGSRVLWNLGQLPRDRTIVTHCQSGGRNAVVASALRSAGFDNIIELEGSFEAWAARAES